MSYFRALCFSCAYFQSCFLGGEKNPQAYVGNEDSLQSEYVETETFFPWLPPPCLFFTSRTTEKANIIFYLTNETEALNRGLWTKIYACSNCEIGKLPANLSKEGSFLKGFSHEHFGRWWQSITKLEKVHLGGSSGDLEKATAKTLMAIKILLQKFA